MARTTRRQPEASSDTRGAETSKHSHIEYGSTRGNWDRGASSDFAITTVNVPDRLDTMEVRSRAASEASSPQVSRVYFSDVVRWFWRLIALAILGALIWGGVKLLGPVRAAISPAGIGLHLGQALGVPVSVRDSELRLLPSPRLVVTDITVQSGFRLPEASIYFNWRDAVRGLQAAKWVLGEARIAPTRFSGSEALALLQSVRGASRLPAAVSTMRFESVEFTDLTLLPGRYEAVVRRGVNQPEFNSISLKRLDAAGQMEVEITAPAVAGGDAQFALFASNWLAPAGPAIAWNEATAQGSFRADGLKVDSYNVGTRFGSMNGAAVLSRSGNDWRLAGNLKGANISVEDLLLFLRGTPGTESGVAQYGAPAKGMARFDLAVAGSGGTVDEALRRASVSGPAAVASATLEGANLGIAATQGDVASAGGATRFSDLDFEVSGSANGFALRNIVGKAGSLRVYGGVSVDRKLALTGSLRAEVASPRGVASTSIRVGGKATSPTYQY